MGGSGSARPEISFLFIFKIDFSHPIFVAFFEFMVSPQQITATTGCPKKLTNRMLLEPWCTGSITSGWYHLGLKSVFLVLSYKD